MGMSVGTGGAESDPDVMVEFLSAYLPEHLRAAEA